MLRTKYPRLAAISLAAASALFAATRPQYGGFLRLQVRAGADRIDPAGTAAQQKLVPLVFDRLVELDERGKPRPALAVSWRTTDPRQRRWRFTLRPGVRFHNGAPLTARAAAAALQSAGLQAVAAGEELVISYSGGISALLRELAGARCAIFLKGAAGAAGGSGPFRIEQWSASRGGRLLANEEHWAGRPFLDGIEIEVQGTPRDRLLDLELEKADLIELPASEVRRAAQRGLRVWSSAPVELLALKVGIDNALLREALGLSVDRDAIRNVLLQRQGETAASLLPNWLSGYAFLFAAVRDPARARELMSGNPRRQPIPLSYEAGDRLAQAVADRIALDARAARIPLQSTPSAAAGGAGVRLMRLPLASPEAGRALAQMAAALDLPMTGSPSTPQALYDAEAALLAGVQVIPVAWLPQTWAAGRRVRCASGRAVLSTGELRLAEVWLEQGSQ